MTINNYSAPSCATSQLIREPRYWKGSPQRMGSTRSPLLGLDHWQWSWELAVNWNPHFLLKDHWILCLHFLYPKAKGDTELCLSWNVSLILDFSLQTHVFIINSWWQSSSIFKNWINRGINSYGKILK